MRMFLDILEKSFEHLFLSMTALFTALCIAIPLGFYLSRMRNQKKALLIIRAISLLQTCPGLAMIAVIVIALVGLRHFIPLPTTGYLPGILTLSFYAISPILTNTHMGLFQASEMLIDIARGLGMTRRQTLFFVQAPYAIPTILAGVRIAGVWTIGMCTLISLVGSGGLGDLILQGLHNMNPKLILAGTIPAASLAILFEWGMVLIEKWLRINETASC